MTASVRRVSLVGAGVLVLLFAAGGTVYAATGGHKNVTKATEAKTTGNAGHAAWLKKHNQRIALAKKKDPQWRAQAAAAAKRQNVAQRKAAAKLKAHETTTTSSAPECAASNLSVTYKTEELGTMNYFAVYSITNNGSSACSLSGFPTVQAFHPDASDGTVSTPLSITTQQSTTAPTGEEPTDVTIQPSDSAGVIVAFTNNPDDGTCGSVFDNDTSIALTLPGTSQAFSNLRFDSNICPADGDSTVSVSPILPTAAPVSNS
jgi:hypothetical protein